jgi:hypothetical protein
MFRCDLGHIRLSDPAIGCRGGCYSGKGVRKRPGDGHSGLATDVGVVLADAALASLGQRLRGPSAMNFNARNGPMTSRRNSRRTSACSLPRVTLCGDRNHVPTARTSGAAALLQSQEQHPGARADKNGASQARDPTPEGGQFLEKYEDRQEDNPQNVHYAADKQQRHEHPAAADTIRSC